MDLLWLAHATALVLLVFFFAIVLSIVLNVPVPWFEDKALLRGAGTLLVMVVLLVLTGVLQHTSSSVPLHQWGEKPAVCLYIAHAPRTNTA